MRVSKKWRGDTPVFVLRKQTSIFLELGVAICSVQEKSFSSHLTICKKRIEFLVCHLVTVAWHFISVVTKNFSSCFSDKNLVLTCWLEILISHVRHSDAFSWTLAATLSDDFCLQHCSSIDMPHKFYDSAASCKKMQQNHGICWSLHQVSSNSEVEYKLDIKYRNGLSWALQWLVRSQKLPLDVPSVLCTGFPSVRFHGFWAW